MTEKYCAVMAAAASSDSAKSIAKRLLEKRLAACINIIPAAESLYILNGEINECREALLIIKTRSDKFEALTEEIKKLHSYDIPEILKFAVVDGNFDFINWIDECVE